MRQRLTEGQHQSNNTSTILDRFNIAALITDERGYIHYHNAKADFLLQQQKKIRLIGNRLQIPGVQQLLNKLIHQAVHSAQGYDCLTTNTILLYSDSGIATHEILVEPFCGSDLRFGFQFDKTLALVLINELVSEQPLNGKILTELFGLTEKELLLAQEMVSGRTLVEISKQTQRSMNTLKSQLKSLFIKTNTTSQAKLVSRLLSSIAAVGLDQ